MAVILDPQVSLQRLPGQQLLVPGAQQRIAGIDPLQLERAELGQRDHCDAGFLLRDGIQGIGGLLVALTHHQLALGAGQAEKAAGRLLGNETQLVFVLLAGRLDPLVFHDFLPAIGIITHQGLLVAHDQGRHDEVAGPLVEVFGQILRPDKLGPHIRLAAQSQHFLGELDLCAGR